MGILMIGHTNNEEVIYHGYWNIWRRRRRITINKIVTGTNHGQGSAEMEEWCLVTPEPFLILTASWSEKWGWMGFE